MKRIAISLSMLLISAMVFGQSTVITKYFDKFSDNEDFVKVSISSKMFSLFTELEAGSDAEKEFLEAASKLKGMKMIVGDSVDGAATLYKQAIKDIQGAGLEELMTVTDAEENFQFLIKDKDGKIEELMMVAGGKKNFVLLSLYGEIDLKNISKIARAMNVDGLSKLSKIDESDN